MRLLKISVTNSEKTDGLDKLLKLEALALGQPATAEAKMSKFDENIHTTSKIFHFITGGETKEDRICDKLFISTYNLSIYNKTSRKRRWSKTVTVGKQNLFYFYDLKKMRHYS